MEMGTRSDGKWGVTRELKSIAMLNLPAGSNSASARAPLHYPSPCSWIPAASTSPTLFFNHALIPVRHSLSSLHVARIIQHPLLAPYSSACHAHRDAMPLHPCRSAFRLSCSCDTTACRRARCVRHRSAVLACFNIRLMRLFFPWLAAQRCMGFMPSLSPDATFASHRINCVTSA
jgi:hypothetical protein